MRICNLIPSYQILSFISICFPNSYIYLQGFTEVLQGVALYAFLMLLCDFMAPNDKSKVEFFSSLEIKRQWQPKKKRNGLAFLSVSPSVPEKEMKPWLTDRLILVDLVLRPSISSRHLDYCCLPSGHPVITCLLPREYSASFRSCLGMYCTILPICILEW